MISETVTNQYGLTSPTITELSGGLINQTFKAVDNKQTLVIQKLHSKYNTNTVHRYKSICEHLQQKDIPMPKLIPTNNGNLFVQDNDLYRAFEYIQCDNTDYSNITPQKAGQLGKMLAKIHHALQDFPEKAIIPTKEFHNTPLFLKKLSQAAASQPTKANLVEKELLFVGTEARYLIKKVPIKTKIVHGDPKFFNYLFRGPRIVGVVDFDEVSVGNIYLEIGDALRDWSIKDEVHFDRQAFTLALAYYRSKTCFKVNNKAVINAVKLITIELCIRFLTDYFEESYFTWDSKNYSSSAEHNLTRAKNTIKLYADIMKKL